MINLGVRNESRTLLSKRVKIDNKRIFYYRPGMFQGPLLSNFHKNDHRCESFFKIICWINTLKQKKLSFYYQYGHMCNVTLV